MKKLTASFVLLGLTLFLGGGVLGYNLKTTSVVDCNLEESMAVKGCEIAAIQVHNQLMSCEYKLERVEEMVINYCEKLMREQ